MDKARHRDAIRRYSVLIGRADDSTAQERMDAAEHRNEYGDEYMPVRESGPENAALLLRFMHEVHGIPLSEASESVIELLRDLDALGFDGHDPVAVATGLLRATGNVFVAAAAANLYAAAAKGSAPEQSWEDVVNAIWYADLVEDDKEAEGRTLH